MGRTACTEPQCLYKSALYLIFVSMIFEIPSVTVLYILKGQGSYAHEVFICFQPLCRKQEINQNGMSKYTNFTTEDYLV